MACRRRRYNVVQALQAILESGSEDSDDCSPKETSSNDTDSESNIEDIRDKPVNHGSGVRSLIFPDGNDPYIIIPKMEHFFTSVIPKRSFRSPAFV